MKTSRYTNQKWNNGDVYAYKLDSALAKAEGLSGRYFLLQKVDEIEISPRMITPVVYIKITKDDTLPKNVQEYDRLEYVQTKTTTYEEWLWTYADSNLEENTAKIAKYAYKADAYGLFSQFRAILLLQPGTQIPSHLTYMGCFADAAPPKEEFIPRHEQNCRMIYWMKNAKMFDRIMIRAYCEHNLRMRPANRDQAKRRPANSSQGNMFLS